jgi:hypothetical protein
MADLHDTLVIFPDNTELDDTLGDLDDLEVVLKLWLFLEESGSLEGGDQLGSGLFEFGFAWEDHGVEG